MAQTASAVTEAKGYAFNAAGLHPNTVGRAPYGVSPAEMLHRGGFIDAYHSTADPLTNLQQGAGYLPDPLPVPLLPVSVPRPHQALGIPHALPPAPSWQHEWGELVKHNPLTTGKDMALDGHGVDPQMVDNIEAQKGQDTATLTQFVGPTP